MAIIKLGATVVGVRGTIGGITYSANKAGPYAKKWARPPRTQTLLQNAQSKELVNVAKLWRDLTAGQQDDWNDWADTTAPARFNSLGEAIALSGFNWFCEMNTQLVLMAQTPESDAPSLAEPAAPDLTDWRVSTDNDPTTRLQYTTDDFDGFFQLAYIAQAIGTGPNSFARSNYKAFHRNSPGASSTQYFNVMEDAYGSLQLNRRWFLRVAKVNAEGLRGPFSQAVTDTVA